MKKDLQIITKKLTLRVKHLFIKCSRTLSSPRFTFLYKSAQSILQSNPDQKIQFCCYWKLYMSYVCDYLAKITDNEKVSNPPNIINIPLSNKHLFSRQFSVPLEVCADLLHRRNKSINFFSPLCHFCLHNRSLQYRQSRQVVLI